MVRKLLLPLFLVLAATEAGCMDHRVAGKSVEDIFPDERDAALARAACEGNVAGIHAAISSGGNVNAVGYQGMSPLAWALSCEDHAGLEALLKAGADPDHQLGETHWTVLMAAAGYHDPELLRLMIRYGGNVNYVREGVETPLEVALSKGMHQQKWDNYYTLLDAGADIDMVYNGTTIVENAAMLNQFEKVSELLDRGYRHDLNSLALYVSTDNVVPEAAEAGNALIAKLKSLGVPYEQLHAEHNARLDAEYQKVKQREREYYSKAQR